MSRLFDTYRSLHEQGFVPIFVKDNFDTKVLLEGCLQAGINCIEYTLRREDANKMIPWIRKNYPDLHIIVGSTIDEDKIVTKAQKNYTQLLTLSQLAKISVDGFISLTGWKNENIRKYSKDHIVIPAAETLTEALRQISAGAHFIKMAGVTIDDIKQFRSKPTFNFCPLLITGGMILEKIPYAIEAGATLIAGGFDLTLKNMNKDISVGLVADVMKKYLDAVRQARQKYFPELIQNIDNDKQTWLNILPHYHPF